MSYGIRSDQRASFIVHLVAIIFTSSLGAYGAWLALYPNAGIPEYSALRSSQGMVAWVTKVERRGRRDHLRFHFQGAAREFIYSSSDRSMQRVLDALRTSGTRQVVALHASSGQVVQVWELRLGSEAVIEFSDKAAYEQALNQRVIWFAGAFLLATALLVRPLLRTLRRRADWRKAW